jgi:hypothetical protein
MKKMFFTVLLGAFTLSSIAQDAAPAASDSIEGFRFTTVDSIAITPVKDQTAVEHVGAIPPLVSLRANSCVWAREFTT